MKDVVDNLPLAIPLHEGIEFDWSVEKEHIKQPRSRGLISSCPLERAETLGTRLGIKSSQTNKALMQMARYGA